MPTSPTNRVARAASRPRKRGMSPSPRAVATALRIQAARNGYDITVEERDERLDAQLHRCAICRRPFRVPAWHLVCTFEGTTTGRRIGTSPAVDHNHRNGVVRGLLCRFCNRNVVTMVERHPEAVARAIQYVRGDGLTDF